MGVIQLGSFGPNQEVRFECEFNDGNRRVTRVRSFNQVTGAARATLIDPADQTIVAQTTFPAGQMTQVNVAGAQVVVGPEGVDLPYATLIQYPVP